MTPWLPGLINCAGFFSRLRDPLAFTVDALVSPLDEFNLIQAFPPLKHLPHLLLLVEMEVIPVILITPNCLWRMFNLNHFRLLANSLWPSRLSRSFVTGASLLHSISTTDFKGPGCWSQSPNEQGPVCFSHPYAEAMEFGFSQTAIALGRYIFPGMSQGSSFSGSSLFNKSRLFFSLDQCWALSAIKSQMST